MTRNIAFTLWVLSLLTAGAAVFSTLKAGNGIFGRRPEVVHACPMHAEARQIGEGRCPRCKMNLVPLNRLQARGPERGWIGWLAKATDALQAGGKDKPGGARVVYQCSGS